jgi:hypothetical protein
VAALREAPDAARCVIVAGGAGIFTSTRVTGIDISGGRVRHVRA